MPNSLEHDLHDPDITRAALDYKTALESHNREAIVRSCTIFTLVSFLKTPDEEIWPYFAATEFLAITGYNFPINLPNSRAGRNLLRAAAAHIGLGWKYDTESKVPVLYNPQPQEFIHALLNRDRHIKINVLS